MKTSHSYDSAAEDQAALWAARLDGDTLDRAQRAELDAWLAENPAHRALLSQYCQLSADLEERIPALVASGAVAMPKAATTASRRKSRWSSPFVAGVSLAAAAALAVAVWVVLPAANVQNIATAPRQRDVRTLADGTRVELNAQTSLRFDNNGNERHARLAGGEAFFMVTKDPSRPFFVDTPTGSVRVTGTMFNVRTEPSAAAFEVTVVEGSVVARASEAGGTRSSAPESLVANEQLVAHGSAVAKQQLTTSQVEDALAWREGKIVFRDTPLEEALARFARYHGCSLTAAAAVAKEPVGSTYSIEDLNGFLSGLELILPVKVQRDPSGAVLVSPRP
jgi:transmembrane sensor